MSPDIAFTYHAIGRSVTFTPHGDLTDPSWAMGNGTTVAALAHTYAYPADGDYTVVLSATVGGEAVTASAVVRARAGMREKGGTGAPVLVANRLGYPTLGWDIRSAIYTGGGGAPGTLTVNTLPAVQLRLFSAINGYDQTFNGSHVFTNLDPNVYTLECRIDGRFLRSYSVLITPGGARTINTTFASITIPTDSYYQKVDVFYAVGSIEVSGPNGFTANAAGGPLGLPTTFAPLAPGTYLLTGVVPQQSNLPVSATVTLAEGQASTVRFNTGSSNTANLLVITNVPGVELDIEFHENKPSPPYTLNGSTSGQTTGASAPYSDTVELFLGAATTFKATIVATKTGYPTQTVNVQGNAGQTVNVPINF